MSMWCAQKSEGITVLGTVITDGFELPCGCWELKPGPLEEQPLLLTTEPSLQPANSLVS